MFKRYIFSLCVFTCSAIISMQQKENNVNDRFLVLCKQADTTPLVNFLTEHEKNSNFNINYCDNDGTSGPLHAARSGCWNNVFYLLDNTSADIMMRNKYSETVLFQGIHRDNMPNFARLVCKYPPKAIYKNIIEMPIFLTQSSHLLCPSSVFDDDTRASITNLLKSTTNVDVTRFFAHNATALNIACGNKLIPLIWKLACKSASFEEFDTNGDTPYMLLQNGYNSYAKHMFVLRELFTYVTNEQIDNKPIVIDVPPRITRIILALDNYIGCHDVALYIAKLCTLSLQQDLLKKQQKYIWRPILCDLCGDNELREDLPHLDFSALNEDNLSQLSPDDLRQISLHALTYQAS